ncbi:MAG: TlpA family protein disulfide reductase [Anaerolineales bacterium]|jgi:thiol-disulfide isomerase/thioredoxin|uniref:TlpA family protein disulfide reductase n=1 Tax=Candidatus Villigracilis vicinus TaxID=3140679 RepID=UPI003134DAFE|nr:TlpA family protein disulfide reductase [Anaerolineales bacterium]MBK7451574.1 TlpA family protein disulfide reductase [Anaerolineales bacterium]
MDTNDAHQQTPLGRVLALIMIGCGFLAMGIAFMLLNEQDVSASAQDFSTVPVQVDFPAPELSLTTLEGEPVSLSDYLGSVVLVNLWATWCPPCREEMPTLQAFYEDYKSEGFVLIAIDQGETSQLVNPFVQEFGLEFPVWLDPASTAGYVFKTMNLPSSYVIDRTGQVRLMWIGGIAKKNLEKYVPEVIME